MARKTSALDEAITLIEILQRIPKHRKVTLLEIQEGLAASGIELRTRTLQRYLKAITETPAFGIECDQRARPYGYKQGGERHGHALAPGLSARVLTLTLGARAYALYDPEPTLEVTFAPF